MSPPLEQHWMQRARALTQALIISGTLNIGLLSTFIYFILKEKQSVVSLEMQPSAQVSKQSFTNEQILRAYSKASFGELLLKMEDRELVEDGYTKRDLALASLTAFHCFPLSKVLGEAELQKRVISFQGPDGAQHIDLVAFSGLKDEHFEAVLRFARTEKWPLTTQGIYLTLQRSSVPYDPSLLEAFYITPEFHHIQTLLQKSAPSLEKSALVEVLKAGPWENLKEVAEKLKASQLYDEETSRAVLINYAFAFGSKIAASALLQHQSEYIVKRLKDEQLLSFFDLNIDQKEALESMAKELLVSPRSDLVRQKAAAFLYSAAQEMMPQPYDHAVALHRFFPEKVKQVPVALQATPTAVKVEKVRVRRTHIIQAGDSLWKIARKYGTTVDAIMKLNHMDTERLRLGRTLEIPESFR